MRNKPYVAALTVPAVLLLFWAISLWWRDYNVMSLLPGGLAAALFVAASRVSKAASFAPTNQPTWDSSRPEEVNRWLANRGDEEEQPLTR